KQLSLRFDLSYYQIEAMDAKAAGAAGSSNDRVIRNLNFRARNLELSALAIYNFKPNYEKYNRRHFFNPYLILGIGQTTNRPRTYLPGEEGNYSVKLWEIQTEEAAPVESYPKMVTVVPYGIGVRLKVSSSIDVLFEASRRLTFSDYLDDVATVYPSLEEVIAWNGGPGSEKAAIAVKVYDRSEEGGFPARKKGNIRGSDNNDSYYMLMVKVEVYIPYKFLKVLFSPKPDID
ncbi:MAG TPA: hypothetical protein VIN11_00930, partial [Roseivirga sp.]